MLNEKVPLTLGPGNANILRYQTQVVQHSGERYNRPPPGAITGTTALIAAPIVLAVQGVLTSAIEWGAAAMVEAAAVDAASGAFADETSTEVIVTTSIYDGEIMRYRQANTFYVQDQDFVHYEPGRREVGWMMY